MQKGKKCAVYQATGRDCTSHFQAPLREPGFPSSLTGTRISKLPYGNQDFQAPLREPGFPSSLTGTRISKLPYGKLGVLPADFANPKASCCLPFGRQPSAQSIYSAQLSGDSPSPSRKGLLRGVSPPTSYLLGGSPRG